MNERTRALWRWETLSDDRHRRFTALKAEQNQIHESLRRLQEERITARMAVVSKWLTPPERARIEALATRLELPELNTVFDSEIERRATLERELDAATPSESAPRESDETTALRREVQRLAERLDAFDHPALDEPDDATVGSRIDEPFDRFWRAMTLTAQRSRAAVDELLAKLAVDSIEEARRARDVLRERHREATAALLRKDPSSADDPRRARLARRLAEFEGDLIDALRHAILRHSIGRRIATLATDDDSGRGAVARCHAVEEKLLVLGVLRGRVEALLRDRAAEIDEMHAVRARLDEPDAEQAQSARDWLDHIERSDQACVDPLECIHALHHTVYTFEDPEVFARLLTAHHRETLPAFLGHDAELLEFALRFLTAGEGAEEEPSGVDG